MGYVIPHEQRKTRILSNKKTEDTEASAITLTSNKYNRIDHVFLPQARHGACIDDEDEE